jgi:hypothetical protein
VSDIFTEVDEEVRREQLKKLWERYGNYIIAACVLVVAAVAAWRGYDYWQIKRAAESGAAYDAAAQLASEGKHADAEAAFAKIAADGTSGYRVLARLREAAEIAERDPKAAVDAYDTIAGETRQPLISELATIRAGFLLVDTAKLDDMTRRLEPLAQPSGAFRHTARELLALSAWRNGDTAAARRWSEAAKSDPEAPSGVRSRMDVLGSLLAGPANGPVPAAGLQPTASPAEPGSELGLAGRADPAGPATTEAAPEPAKP